MTWGACKVFVWQRKIKRQQKWGNVQLKLKLKQPSTDDMATNLKKALILEEQIFFALSTIRDDQVSNEKLTYEYLTF